MITRMCASARALADHPAAVTVKDRTFHLHGTRCTYSFYVSDSGDLIHSHFGGSSHSTTPPVPQIFDGGWIYGPPDYAGKAQRELPDLGNGDFRQPAIRVRHGDGTTITSFKYASYEIVRGKAGIEGLPATHGGHSDATTLFIKLVDDIARLECTISYAIFPAHNAIVRSLSIHNMGVQEVVVEVAASFSIDLPAAERQMIGLSGDWGREGQLFRRQIYPGQQGRVLLISRVNHSDPLLASSP
jgi:alpha-galactosidase